MTHRHSLLPGLLLLRGDWKGEERRLRSKPEKAPVHTAGPRDCQGQAWGRGWEFWAACLCWLGKQGESPGQALLSFPSPWGAEGAGRPQGRHQPQLPREFLGVGAIQTGGQPSAPGPAPPDLTWGPHPRGHGCRPRRASPAFSDGWPEQRPRQSPDHTDLSDRVICDPLLSPRHLGHKLHD